MSELTIEQMRQIVDGAPDWAKGYNTAIQKYTRNVWFSKDILLSDLKAQIDQHYYGQSEEKELEQYSILSQEKIEGGAVLVGGSCIQKMVDYQDVIANQKAEIDQLKAEKASIQKRFNFLLDKNICNESDHASLKLRIGSLLSKWKKDSEYAGCVASEDFVQNTLDACVDDLEKALRGES